MCLCVCRVGLSIVEVVAAEPERGAGERGRPARVSLSGAPAAVGGELRGGVDGGGRDGGGGGGR